MLYKFRNKKEIENCCNLCKRELMFRLFLNVTFILKVGVLKVYIRLKKLNDIRDRKSATVQPALNIIFRKKTVQRK